MKFCGHCGTQMDDEARFCHACGWDSQPGNGGSYSGSTTSQNGGTQGSGAQTKGTRGSDGMINRLNQYMGNDGPVDLNWRCLFSDVLNKHDKQEAERLFVCGTPETTPSLENLTSNWPRPWLYSRVLGAFLLAYFLLRICVEMFGNELSLPGLIVVGSFTIPIATMVLFMELNAYRNISFYHVAKTFLVGGCASLVVTLILFSVSSFNGQLTVSGACLVGIIEEVGKLLIVYFFIRRIPQCDNILGGLLIGAAVGAGFAAFESAGYAFVIFQQGGYEIMTNNILVRGFLAPGGHVAWAAISGAALVIASDGLPLSSSAFGSSKFWKLFIIPVILHAIWDMPFSSLIVTVALLIIVWIVILILVNMGLGELAQRSAQYKK